MSLRVPTQAWSLRHLRLLCQHIKLPSQSSCPRSQHWNACSAARQKGRHLSMDGEPVKAPPENLQNEIYNMSPASLASCKCCIMPLEIQSAVLKFPAAGLTPQHLRAAHQQAISGICHPFPNLQHRQRHGLLHLCPLCQIRALRTKASGPSKALILHQPHNSNRLRRQSLLLDHFQLLWWSPRWQDLCQLWPDSKLLPQHPSPGIMCPMMS